MTTEKFQLLNMVEMIVDEDERVKECHSSIRLLDTEGKVTYISLHYALYAAVDVVASIYKRAEEPKDPDEFIEEVEGMLRRSIEVITTQGLQ